MRVLDKFHELWKAEVEATGKEPAGFLIGEDDWPRIWSLIHAENPMLSAMLLDEEGHGYMKFSKFPILFTPGSKPLTIIRKQPLTLIPS